MPKDRMATLCEYYVGFLNNQKRIPSLKPITASLSQVLARLLLILSTYQQFVQGKTLVVEFPYSEIENTLKLMQSLIDTATINLDTPWDFIVALRGECACSETCG